MRTQIPAPAFNLPTTLLCEVGINYALPGVIRGMVDFLVRMMCFFSGCIYSSVSGPTSDLGQRRERWAGERGCCLWP